MHEKNDINYKKMIMKYDYEPPKVEVIEVEVEGGFAISGYGQDSDDSEFGDSYYLMEEY